MGKLVDKNIAKPPLENEQQTKNLQKEIGI
jgi:hypothetical protein